MTVAIDHIECLGCGQFRPPPSEQAECPFCAYVGWAPSSALTEGERAWYAALRLASAPRWQLQRAAI